MAGIYCALLGKMRGEPASFNAIGKGFGFFSQGFVIALLSGLPFALLTIAARVFEWRFEEIQKTYPGTKPVPPEVLTEQVVLSLPLVCRLGLRLRWALRPADLPHK